MGKVLALRDNGFTLETVIAMAREDLPDMESVMVSYVNKEGVFMQIQSTMTCEVAAMMTISRLYKVSKYIVEGSEED